MKRDLGPGRAIKVLIGEVNLTRHPNRLCAVLGSCIGLVIYDPGADLAGMAHVLLPDSSGRRPSELPGKYADQAVPCLRDGLVEFGAHVRRLRAKVAGGAHMFAGTMAPRDEDVGAQNIKAVEAALRAVGIPLLGKDVGGPSGRKVEFLLDRQELVVEDFEARRIVV